MDTGFHTTRYEEHSRQRLDIATLAFFQSFRKVYVGEQAMHASKVYTRLSERMGLNDHLMVLNITVSKIATNLKCYVNCDEVVEVTLNLFQVFACAACTLAVWDDKVERNIDVAGLTPTQHTHITVRRIPNFRTTSVSVYVVSTRIYAHMIIYT